MPVGTFYDTPSVDLSQPLSDIGRNGRPRPWAEHRSNGELLAWAYEGYKPEKSARLRGCAPWLTFTRAEESEGLKLKTAWFCRVRLCPVCQWRRSLKVYGQAVEVMRAAEERNPGKYAWLMLTLTQRNVPGEKLSAELSAINSAWHRLTVRKEWQQIARGTMRTLEVTHNLDRDSPNFDTYHPHIHVVLCVDAGYFKSRHYLSAARWGELWRDAMRLDYAPSIEVHRIKTGSGSMLDPLAEIAKYTTKPGDYIIPDDLELMEVTVKTLDTALHRRRLVSWSGILKDLHSELGQDDTEDGDLVHVQDDAEDVTNDHLEISYAWAAGYRQYFRGLE